MLNSSNKMAAYHTLQTEESEVNNNFKEIKLDRNNQFEDKRIPLKKQGVTTIMNASNQNLQHILQHLNNIYLEKQGAKLDQDQEEGV